MPVSFELTELATAVAIGLVLAMLATLLVLLVRAARRKGGGGKQAATASPAPQQPPPIDTQALAVAVKRAEAADDKARLPSLYLALAGAQLADGKRSNAADSLRRSIVVAAELGRHEDHALARLELGDLCLEDGDLTSACEHWQIARSLFHGLQQARRCAEAEARMKETRCPTDWVLNEF